MKKSIGLIFASVLAAALVAGCNSGNNNNNNNGFGTNCGAPPAGFQILYPRNNAPRVPPGNAGGVYVAAKPPLVVGNSYNFLPVVQTGSLPFTSTFATYNGAIPSPHNSPAPGSTVYFTSFLYPIGPLQTVQLLWNDGGTGCTPNAIVSTFTTGQ
jgi:hypothetical protein